MNHPGAPNNYDEKASLRHWECNRCGWKGVRAVNLRLCPNCISYDIKSTSELFRNERRHRRAVVIPLRNGFPKNTQKEDIFMSTIPTRVTIHLGEYEPGAIEVLDFESDLLCTIELDPLADGLVVNVKGNDKRLVTTHTIVTEKP